MDDPSIFLPIKDVIGTERGSGAMSLERFQGEEDTMQQTRPASDDGSSGESDAIVMRPIGRVHSSRATVEDDRWDAVEAFIELESPFTAEALIGLDAFSHVEVVFVMDRVEPGKVEREARHPRNNPAWPRIGIFAQRAKNRPNAIGTTICRILRVEGLRLHVHGLDAVDGSPVLDLKPWVMEFGPRGGLRQPAWITELMQHYWE